VKKTPEGKKGSKLTSPETKQAACVATFLGGKSGRQAPRRGGETKRKGQKRGTKKKGGGGLTVKLSTQKFDSWGKESKKKNSVLKRFFLLSGWERAREKKGGESSGGRRNGLGARGKGGGK